MGIPLRRELVRALIERRFSSVGDLVVAWEEWVSSGAQKVGTARNRATIYRWLDKGLPGNRSDIFGFAAMLDVDPVALLDITEDYIRKGYGRERRLFQLGMANRAPLAAFWPIYTPGPGWPNAEVSHPYYGRAWCTADFAHDPATIANVYAAIHLRSKLADDPIVPRTYHFAYRRTGSPDGMWRPYGTVVGYEGEVCLLMENGTYQRQPETRSPAVVVAETWFGPGPAEFRVAALHEFEVTVQVPSEERGVVRFLA